MDVIKYRKLYLSENWGENRFRMIKYRVVNGYNYTRVFNRWFGANHPLVTSGKAYWINKDELCTGYKLDSNPKIYRPIFSHKRQRLLDEIIKDIINPYKFWNKVRTQYFASLYKIKNLPVVCIENIIMLIC